MVGNPLIVGIGGGVVAPVDRLCVIHKNLLPLALQNFFAAVDRVDETPGHAQRPYLPAVLPGDKRRGDMADRKPALVLRRPERLEAGEKRIGALLSRERLLLPGTAVYHAIEPPGLCGLLLPEIKRAGRGDISSPHATVLLIELVHESHRRGPGRELFC